MFSTKWCRFAMEGRRLFKYNHFKMHLICYFCSCPRTQWYRFVIRAFWKWSKTCPRFNIPKVEWSEVWNSYITHQVNRHSTGKATEIHQLIIKIHQLRIIFSPLEMLSWVSVICDLLDTSNDPSEVMTWQVCRKLVRGPFKSLWTTDK